MKKFELTPKQQEMAASTADHLLIGGSRGGAKTAYIVWAGALKPRKTHYTHMGKTITEHQALKLKKQKKRVKFHIDKVSIDYPEYTGLILRRSHPEFVKILFPMCEDMYIRRLGARWVERNKCFVFPSGAKVFAGHCKDYNALATFLGGNYDWCAIDEANHFYWDWIQKIDASVRSKLFKSQLLLSANPGGRSHHDIKKKFVDRCPPVIVKKAYSKMYNEHYDVKIAGKPYTDEYGLVWHFVPASVFDNPHLLENDEAYVRKLQGLSENLKKQWLHGSWDAFAGAYFDQFDILHHVVEEEDFVYNEHFNTNTHKIYAGIDYGTKNNFVCAFTAVDEDGNAIVFEEIVEKGLSATQQAQLIKKVLKEKYELEPRDITAWYADPSVFHKTQNAGNYLRSVANFYADEDIYLLRGNNDRKLGAKVYYELLRVPEQPEEGKGKYIPPIVRFRSNCEYGIETIPTLPSKENDPEDIDTDSEDHFYDATRYCFIEILAGQVFDAPERKKGWRDRLVPEEETGVVSWRTA